jgi:hypothetical protein
MVEIFIVRDGQEINIGFTRKMQVQNDVIFDHFLMALIPFKMEKIEAEEGWKKYLLCEKS